MNNNDIKIIEISQLELIKIVEIIIKNGGGINVGKAVIKEIGINCGSCRAVI